MSGMDSHYDAETDTLEIPLEEVNNPCQECGSTLYPNYKWKVLTYQGVLCPACIVGSMLVLTDLGVLLEKLI